MSLYFLASIKSVTIFSDSNVCLVTEIMYQYNTAWFETQHFYFVLTCIFTQINFLGVYSLYRPIMIITFH
jgi:hypothetical protein